MPIEQYLEVVLLLLVSIAAINDLATRRIPNRLLLVGLASALILHLVSAAPGVALLSALGGMGIGMAMFLPFYLVRGMAAGDVKLMAVIGFFSGPGETFSIAVLTWCLGGLMALFLIFLRRGRLRLALANIGNILSGVLTSGTRMETLEKQQSAGAMPYGLAMALATIILLVRQHG
jgi:prepilin peptidase CpaA